MAGVKLRQGTLYAAYYLAQHARQEDVDEWVAGTGDPLSTSLPDTVRGSLVCRELRLWRWTPLAMWGCTPTERDDTRQVWFVAAQYAPRFAISIHRHFKSAIAEMHEGRYSLRAYSYWRNVKHHRWLEAHGFDLQGVHASVLGIPCLSFLRGPP